jgi:hypothetical protein
MSVNSKTTYWTVLEHALDLEIAREGIDKTAAKLLLYIIERYPLSESELQQIQLTHDDLRVEMFWGDTEQFEQDDQLETVH